MNIVKFLKVYNTARKLFGLFEEARVSKSLFASKIFWLQVLTLTQSLTGILPIPPEYLAPLDAVLTALLRVYGTSQPVHVV